MGFGQPRDSPCLSVNIAETQRDHGIRGHDPCMVSSSHNQVEGAGISAASLQSAVSPSLGHWSVSLW